MGKRGLVLLLAALPLTIGLTAAEPIESSPSLEDLIARIPEVATDDEGIDQAEQKLARELGGFGPDSVPRLVGLLESDNPKVRRFAGYVVADLDGLKESDLDALIAARKRGDGWIPAAIGRIGTPKAITFLVDDIRREPQAHTQVTGALVRAGEKAAPALAAFFGDQSPIDRKLSQTIGTIFAEMGANARIAVPMLLEYAANRDLPTSNRLGAVAALGQIGIAAAEAVPRLRELAKAEPKVFSTAVEQAILGIGTTDAAAILAARLQEAPQDGRLDIILRDIAELKENGRSAGPAVVEILYAEDWDARVCAARTLGYIGYGAASADLKRMLKSDEDWRLVFTATESLGRLKDSSALADLGQLAKEHWSPVVRAAALKAIQVIQGDEVYKSRWHPTNFAFEYFEYWGLGYESSLDLAQNDSIRATIEKQARISDPELAKITYTIQVSDSDEDDQHMKQRKVLPGCSLRFGGGVLVGRDQGEWGGELAYLNEQGAARILVPKNTHALHRMPFGVIATVGLAHITMNSGFIYLVSENRGGPPSAKPWKALPGAPKESAILENGDLFVACHGGDVLVTPTGEFRRVD